MIAFLLQPRLQRWIWALALVGNILLLGGRTLLSGSPVSSDGVFYYSALRSMAVDRDLSLENEYSYFLGAVWSYSGKSKIPRPEERPELAKNPVTGRQGMLYPIGVPLLLLPPFALVHGVCLGLARLGFSVDTSGYGMLYQMTAAITSLLYGFLGALLVYFCGRRFFDANVAFLGALSQWLASPLLYHMAVAPLLSHAASAFAVAIFTWWWLKIRTHDRGGSRWLVLGALGGLAAMVRYQDGIFLLLPGLDLLATTWRTPKDERGRAVAKMGARAALLAVGCLAVFSLQLWTNHYLTGGFRTGYAGFGFTHLWNPKILQSLFAPQYGLIFMAPATALSLSGLWLFIPSDKRLAYLFILGFAVQLYLTSSWSQYHQGQTFGNRILLNCTVIFGIGYMGFLKYLAVRYSSLMPGLRISLILSGWNVVLIGLYCYFRAVSASLFE